MAFHPADVPVADLYRQYRFQRALPTVGPSYEDTPATWTDWVLHFDELDRQVQAETEARHYGV